MTGFNLIKNLGGFIKQIVPKPTPITGGNSLAKFAAKSLASYSTQSYSTHEALKSQDTEDKNKQTKKTSTTLAKNQEAAESRGLEDVKLESGRELNGAGSSRHFFSGPQEKSDFEQESGLTIEQFDELLEYGYIHEVATPWEKILELPLHLLPKKFQGKLLKYSIIERDTDVFKQLIFEKGLDVNAGDKDGHEPILFASEMGTSEMAKILLKQGAVPNLEHELLNAYEIAASRGEDALGNTDGMEILRLLFEYCPPEEGNIIQDVGYRLKCKGTDEMHDLARELIGEDLFNDIYDNS